MRIILRNEVQCRSYSSSFSLNPLGLFGLKSGSLVGLVLSSLLLGLSPAFALDYGDAPDSYGVLAGSNGPSHTVDANLRLGGIPDNEGNGLPTANADGDDTAGVDDEDGVVFTVALLTSSTSYFIPAGNVVVTNDTGAPATLHAWIDFDNNGMFEPSEYQSQAVPAGTVNGNLATDLLWTGLSNLPGGVTYIRFRLALDGVLTDDGGTTVDERALGADGIGEVEDYLITYVEPPPIVIPPDTPICVDEGDLLPVTIQQVWDSVGTTAENTYTTPYAGDFNGDGITDLLISSFSGATGGGGTGSISRDGRRFSVFLGPIVPGNTDVPRDIHLDTVWYEWSTTQPWAVADVNPDDNDGAELVVIASDNNNGLGTANDGFLYAYNIVSGMQVWRSNARAGYAGTDDGSPLGFADFNNDGIPEVYAYNRIFNAQTGVLLASGGSTNNIGNPGGDSVGRFGSASVVAAVDINNDADLELAAGGQIYDVVITNTAGTADNTMPLLMDHLIIEDGYTMSADMDLDGDVDLVVLERPKLYIYDGQTDTLMGEIDILSPTRSGIPFIGNMDLDPEPEIAVVTPFRVQAYDFDPGEPVPAMAMSIAWTLTTSDRSGQTGITLFDFNKDGIQEIVYRDETQLRVINALNQLNIASFPCRSTTGHEHPIIADIDNDGRAEAITVCGGGFQGDLRVFQEVLGAPQWASAPPVWNQFGYFRAHINDDLSVPQNQLPHWPSIGPDPDQCLNHNEYPLNAFRSQPVLFEPDVCPIRLAPFDWSDDPASYLTTEVDDGPRHSYCGDLQLGTEATVEDDGIPAPAADSDLLDDGVTFQDFVGGGVAVNIQINGTNLHGEPAMLCAYLDGAADGVVSGTYERNVNYTTVGVGTATAMAGNEEVCVQVAAAGGAGNAINYPAAAGFNGASASCEATAMDGAFACTLSFDPQYPADVTTFARVRLTNDTSFFSNSSPSPTGLAVGGEVESYQLRVSTTAVRIGKIELEAVSVTAFLSELDIDLLDRAALLALLAAWDPEQAVMLANADSETILEAIQTFLDPDDDSQVAVLKWDTLEERGTIGFYAERREGGGQGEGVWMRVNGDLLPSLIDASLGAEYQLADPAAQSGKVYNYQLIELEATGNTRHYGPYTVEMQ